MTRHLEAFRDPSASLLPPHPPPISNCFLSFKPISGSHFILLLLPIHSPRTMLSRASLSRNAPRALAASRRAMASAANPTFQYDVSEAAGVKVANREVEGPTGTLALVAKAGSRYQPFPGFSDALEKFAFKVGLRSHPLTICFRLFGLISSLADHTQAFSIADYSRGRAPGW